jgi:hypothetical protein
MSEQPKRDRAAELEQQIIDLGERAKIEIAGLIETTSAIREHAERLSILVHNWGEVLRHLHSQLPKREDEE